MALSSNALCAKAKAMYGYRIGEEGYSDLCRKQSLSEMVTYLKSQTKDSGVLEDINVRNVHRRQVEAALNKEYFERCARLMKYAPKKNQDFYSQEVIGIEVQLIVDKVVSIKEKDQASFSLEIPDYLASKMSFNIYGLINVDNYKDLVTYLRDTRYYKILADFDFTAPKNADFCLQVYIFKQDDKYHAQIINPKGVTRATLLQKYNGFIYQLKGTSLNVGDEVTAELIVERKEIENQN